MNFKLLSPITEIEVIAVGRGIRELARLQRIYGRGRWRKMKGLAVVAYTGTSIRRIEEVHWYEAHGIGKREIKIKYRG